MLAILQLDCVSLPLVERLRAEGRLPSLARLWERGTFVPLETPAASFAAGVFPTLYSGLEVAEHGLYYPFQWDADAQRVRPVRAFAHPAAVWERLAEAGRRSLVVDGYESWPPARDVGVIANGVGFVNRVVLPAWTAPASVRGELERRLGKPPRVEEVFGAPSLARLARTRRDLVRAPGRAAVAAVELMAREAFDLAWIVFPAAHLAGHQFWNLEQLPEAEREQARRAGLDRALEDVYGAADDALGRVVEALPRDADVIVLSPTGMGPNLSRVELLPGMLAAVLGGGGRTPEAPASDSFVWRMRGRVSTDLRARVAAALPDRVALELVARLETRGVDWSRTRAFALPGDHNGYVRLNLRGRERHGIVDPAEAPALLERIAEGLATFADDDGTPSVCGIERVAERHRGSMAHQLPDLVVSWGDPPRPGLASVSSPRYGAVRREGTGSGRSGNHDGRAWALLCPGRARVALSDRPAQLTDVAASASALLGGDLAGMAGEPLLVPR